MTDPLEGVVLRVSHAPVGDGWAWEQTLRAHRDTCRYAPGSESLGAFLSLWGRDHWAVMVREGTIARCKVCKPDLV